MVISIAEMGPVKSMWYYMSWCIYSNSINIVFMSDQQNVFPWIIIDATGKKGYEFTGWNRKQDLKKVEFFGGGREL